jgi:hypothetical protein
MMVKSEVEAEFTKFARRLVEDASLPQTVRRVESVEVPSEVFPDDVAFAKPMVPRKFGDELKTARPEPLSSPRIPASSDEVSISVERMTAPSKYAAPTVVDAETAPEVFVVRIPAAEPYERFVAMRRFVVVAFVKVRFVPETPVVEAYVVVKFVAEIPVVEA